MRWAITLLVLAAATVGMYLVRGSLDKAHVALVYLLIVLAASAAGGRALGLVVAGLAFLCFDFFFLVPYLTFVIQNPLDWLVLFAFLVTSVVAAQLLYRATATAEEATARAIEVDRLAALGAETLNAADADEALRAIADVIRHSIDADECEIYLSGSRGVNAERAAPFAQRRAGQPRAVDSRPWRERRRADGRNGSRRPRVAGESTARRTAMGVAAGDGRRRPSRHARRGAWCIRPRFERGSVRRTDRPARARSRTPRGSRAGAPSPGARAHRRRAAGRVVGTSWC